MTTVVEFDPRQHLAGEAMHRKRLQRERWFRWSCMLFAGGSVLLLAFLLISIVANGVGTLTAHFLSNPPHPEAEQAGFYPAIWGSVWLLILTSVLVLPLGIGAAIVLEEFKPKNRLLKQAHGFIQLNVTNLAGVPSVVYGIIGLTAFATMFNALGNENRPAFEFGMTYYDQFYNEADITILRSSDVELLDAEPPPPSADDTFYAMIAGEQVLIENINIITWEEDFPEDPALAGRTLRVDEYGGRIEEPSWYYFRLPFGRGVLTGALTLMLVILPVIIIATQEALRAVPESLRMAARGLGATRWQVVRQVTLPAALPGIMTGSIIAMSRAIGEAAPLLMIAGIVYITNAPSNLMSDFTAMPLQIYNWAGRPQAEFHELAASGIVVLLAVLLSFNAIAVFIRQKMQRPLS